LAIQGSDGSGAAPGFSSGSRSDGPFAAPVRGTTARWAWGVFAVLFLVHLLESLDRWLLPAVLRPVSEELELTNAQAGWLATVLLISYALWGPFVGYMADRLRRPRLMAVGIAVWSLATVGTGLARSYNEMQLARALVGIGGSTFGVIALTILMDLYPRGVRARVLSAYYLAMPIGAALALSLGSAIARAATWHTAFVIAGAPGLVLALLALALPDPVRGTSEGVEEHRLRLHERVGPSREDYVDLMVNSSYTYSVFGLAFSMFAIGGLIVWLPTFLVVVHDVPAARANLWLAVIVPAAMVLGMVIGGWLADRYSQVNPRALFLVPGMAMLGSIPCLLLAIFGRDEGMILLGVFLAIALLFTNAGPCHAIIANVVLPNMRAVAYAVAIRLRRGTGGHSPAGRSLVAHLDGLGLRHVWPGRFHGNSVRAGPGRHRRDAQGSARPRPRKPGRGRVDSGSNPGHRGGCSACRRPASAPGDGPHDRQAAGGAEPRGRGAGPLAAPIVSGFALSQ